MNTFSPGKQQKHNNELNQTPTNDKHEEATTEYKVSYYIHALR